MTTVHIRGSGSGRAGTEPRADPAPRAPRRSPTISAAVVGKFIQYAASRGLDARELLGRAGLGPAEARDPELRIPLEVCQGLWAHVARALDDAGLPIHVAQEMRVEDYHVMGFAIATSRSGREALERLCRYSVLFMSGNRWELEDPSGPGEATLRCLRISTFSLGERLAAEHAVAVCLHCFRHSAGQDFAPRRVTFRHPAPRDLSAHRRYYRAPIEFGGSFDGYAFDAALLEVTPRGANAELSAFFGRHAEELRRSAEAEEPLAERVRGAIARELTSGEPSMAAIAKRLATSERSLRRHLADEGTSFREVVDEVRRGAAERLLREGKASIPDVAFLLGFSDVSTFTRAFKRWCGVPPGRFRERAPGPRAHGTAADG